jgi:hypothetical protein
MYPNLINPNLINPNLINPNLIYPNLINPNLINPNLIYPNLIYPNLVLHILIHILILPTWLSPNTKRLRGAVGMRLKSRQFQFVFNILEVGIATWYRCWKGGRGRVGVPLWLWVKIVLTDDAWCKVDIQTNSSWPIWNNAPHNRSDLEPHFATLK